MLYPQFLLLLEPQSPHLECGESHPLGLGAGMFETCVMNGQGCK